LPRACLSEQGEESPVGWRLAQKMQVGPRGHDCGSTIKGCLTFTEYNR
jgi:hypothetical protein